MFFCGRFFPILHVLEKAHFSAEKCWLTLLCRMPLSCFLVLRHLEDPVAKEIFYPVNVLRGVLVGEGTTEESSVVPVFFF